MIPIEDVQQRLSSLGMHQSTKLLEATENEHRVSLLRDLARINWGTLAEQRELLKEGSELSSAPFEPLHIVEEAGSDEDQNSGWQELRERPVACLVVAGGHGSRLGFDKPKGFYPISAIREKTLFQIFAERVQAVSQLTGQAHALAFTIAPEWIDEVKEYFTSHRNFGLAPEQLALIPQGTLPALTEDGELVVTDDKQIAFAPDGNGSSLTSLAADPAWKRWTDLGVRALSFCQIDNALMDPLDAELIGLHSKENVDVTVKCVRRESATESVGLLGERNGGLCVVEYSEIDAESQSATRDNGSLLFAHANISAFCFSAGFINRLAVSDQIGLHKAHKVLPNAKNAGKVWKFERFIFDVLRKADSSVVIEYPRSECFAPLKNREGKHSADEVKQLLVEYDKQVFANLTDQEPPEGSLELAPKLHYLQRQSGLSLSITHGYVDLE